jgi:asparagine synthase (glutamine-hydrolysing)
VPFREWIRQEKYAEILKNTFTGAICRKFFDTDKLILMLDAHVSGRENNARVLYTVCAFAVWYGIYFEKEGKAFGLDVSAETGKGNSEEKEDERTYDGNTRSG